MKLSIVGVAILGIVAALCAAVLVALLTVQPKINHPASEGEVTILVATHDIPQLTLVDGQSIELRKVPRSKVPEQALTLSVEAVGKIMAVPALEGQAFRKDMFVTEGAGAQLAASLPEGKRAVAISVSEFGGLQGILYPGSVVDVILTVRGSGTDPVGLSRAVLSRVPVLAVEGETVVAKDAERQEGTPQKMGDNTRRVTLLVDSRQASQLELASSEGSLSLALRNPMDKRPTDQTPVSMASLLPQPQQGPSLMEKMAMEFMKSGPKPVAAAAPAPAAHPTPAPVPVAKPMWETTILHGTQVEHVQFPMESASDSVIVGQK